MTDYPDSFWSSTRGPGRTSNDDLPADALVLPEVLNRRPYDKEK